MGLSIQSPGEWQSLFSGANLAQLQTQILPEFLQRQRWFGSKSTQIRLTRLIDWVPMDSLPAAIALVQVDHESETAQFYTVPLALAFGAEAGDFRHNSPRAIAAEVASPESDGVLYDATWNPQFCSALLNLIGGGDQWFSQNGKLQGAPSRIFDALRGVEPLPVRRSSAEQSNTSILFGNRLILKLFRHPEPGENPDAEIGRFLTEAAHFDRIPPFGGTIEYTSKYGHSTAVAMLQGLVANQGDGWEWMLQELRQYYKSCVRQPVSARKNDLEVRERPSEALARSCAANALNAARMLGRRTAELHLALAGCDDNPAFAPEPITVDYVEGLQQKIAAQSERTFEVLRRNLSRLTDEASGLGMQLLQFADDLPEGISALTVPANAGLRTRIHGDYHLGQVLVTDEDFVILDFEGEPARSLADRRAKHSPLKDVAGMLRSFSYAASASLSKEADHASADLVSWAELWEQAVSTEFLQVYWQVMQSSSILPPQFASLQTLLNVYLLEKAFYELLYELNNRPAWVQIPLMSILSLLPTLEPARGRKLRPTG